MKNFLKISLITAILFSSFSAIAKDDTFLLKANNENEKSIVFFIGEAQDVDLSIVTADNEIVYEQKIRTSSAAKKIYNLAAFPNGNYSLKLKSELKVTTYQVRIENGKALISEPVVKEIFKPVLVKEKEMVTLDLKTQAKGAVEVIILNEYNDQLYSKSFVQGEPVQKFNISKTNARELTFIVRYKDQEHIETIKVR